MANSPLQPQVLLAGWDPLSFVHEMDWYRHMLWSDWFRPVRRYWLDYHLDWVAAAILLLLVFIMVRRLLRWVFADRSGGRRLAARSARKYEKNGEFDLAAEAWQRAGRPQRAYRIYLQQRQLHQAAELAEQLQRPVDAVAHLREAGDLAEAAAVAERAGLLDQAAELHHQRGEPLAAARLYEKLGDPARAADCYREAGTWRRAAECYLAAGDHAAAAQAALELARWSERATTTGEEARLFGETAVYFEKQRQFAQAALLYEAAGNDEHAATAYLAAGDKAAAARCLERQGNAQEAAALYRELGRTDDWLRLQELGSGGRVAPSELAAALQAAGKFPEAAAVLLEAGLRAEAIAIYLEHDPAEAGRLLAEDGRHREAARAYLQGADPAAAHEQARLAGDLQLAAQAAEQAGLHLEAALALLELGETMRAAGHLQQVPEDDPRYRHAASLLADALWRLGEKELALKTADRSTAGLEPSPANLELFYRQARILEQAGNEASLRRALEIYENIVAVRIDFRDARERRAKLKEQSPSPAGKPPG